MPVKAMEDRLSGVSNKDYTIAGGIKDLVNILNMVEELVGVRLETAIVEKKRRRGLLLHGELRRLPVSGDHE